MNRDGLCKVAEEVNKELGASIKVNTKSTFAGLMEGITEAVEGYEGKAVLSQKTLDFLCEKEVDVPAQIKVKIKEVKAAPAKPAKEKKEKVAGEKKASADEYGFRVGSASSRAAELIMSGKDRKHNASVIEKEFGKSFIVAEGRIKIIERELKARGFLK